MGRTGGGMYRPAEAARGLTVQSAQGEAGSAGRATIAAVDAHLPIPGISEAHRRRVLPASPAAVVVRELLLVAAGALFLALTAQVSVQLPFSPVPLTGQTLGVLLVGALYGPRRGAITVIAYLAE